MKAALTLECECRSKWNIIFLETSENIFSVFSFNGEIREVTNYLILYTVGLIIDLFVLFIRRWILVHPVQIVVIEVHAVVALVHAIGVDEGDD
jgi:hypothetical protein